MANDFATVTVAQPSQARPQAGGTVIPPPLPAASFADRADRGVELLSRWAGILTFAGVVAGIIYLIL